MKEIVLKSVISSDRYTDYVCEKYDLSKRDEIITTIPFFNQKELDSVDWNIGLILGNSGSGKSTILKNLNFNYTKNIDLDYNKPIISQFPFLEPSEVCNLFYGIGLSSVPVWLHKPNELSNGERARFDIVSSIASCLKDKKETIIVIDEFTSVVNRDVAKSMSFSLNRCVRENKIKVIIASCHYDIIEWLQPDWIFNLNKQKDKESILEHMIYKNNSKYNSYSQIDKKDSLTDARSIS